MLTLIHSIMNTARTGDADFDALQKQLYCILSLRHQNTTANMFLGCNKKSSASSVTWAADKPVNAQRVSAVLRRLRQLHPPEAKVQTEPIQQPRHPQARAKDVRRRTPKALPASVPTVVKSAISRPTKSQQVFSFALILARKSQQRKSRRLLRLQRQTTRGTGRGSSTAMTLLLRPRRTTGSLLT